MEIKKVSGGVCAAKGFKAWGTFGGLGKPGKGKDDMAVVLSDCAGTAAAVYTSNKVKAAHISVCKEHLADGKAQAMSRSEALALAEEKNLDLVCVSPNAKPPVCKILDYGKYRYELQKKEKEAKKKQHTTEVKEIRLSVFIDGHVHKRGYRQDHIRNQKRLIIGTEILMAVFIPFKAVRPHIELADKVAAPPYDVVDDAEARRIADADPYSFLHITRAEVDLPEDANPYAGVVYRKAKKNIERYMNSSVLFEETKPMYYIYRITSDGFSQTGIAGCVSIDEYNDGTIKKHEVTLPEKEVDRTTHFDVCGFDTEPVLLTYRHE